MKIFFGLKTFYLIDIVDIHNKLKDKHIVKINSLAELKKEYQIAVDNAKKTEFIFAANNLDLLKNWFTSIFTVIEAAGGVVLNSKKEFLLIYRKGKWDLPKGKIEKNEPVELAAIREVEEECGISELSIVAPIPSTYHIYLQNNKTILKPTHWFEMYSDFKGTLVPQLQEDITKVEWVKKENIHELLPNAYESIREVMQAYVIDNK